MGHGGFPCCLINPETTMVNLRHPRKFRWSLKSQLFLKLNHCFIYGALRISPALRMTGFRVTDLVILPDV